jgi:hypothetical protein
MIALSSVDLDGSVNEGKNNDNKNDFFQLTITLLSYE